ncbi:MAG: hypothetical protein GX444_13630 [Myxococcales bacterium]|nr:hypothetical protein [Myxococcales bacterium]
MKPLLILLLIAGLGLAGCMYVQKQALPDKLYTAEEIQNKNLTVGERVELTRYGFRLFTIPISVPSTTEVTDELINRHQAKGLTDLDIEFSEFNPASSTPGFGAWHLLLFLFQIPKVTVEGKPVYDEPRKP